MKLVLAAFLAFLAAPSLGRAAAISYVQATSQYQLKEDRGRYHPLNLLDDNPETIWCADPGNGAGEGIDIVFKHKQKIDRVVINPTPKSGSVVRSVRITDGVRTVTVEVGTASAAEVFNHPLEGTKFSIAINAVGEANEGAPVPKDVVCLADTLLYLHEALFGGGAGRPHYDALTNRLVGSWNGGPLGAPERVLTFSEDGSWEWVYTPLLGGKGKRFAGEYRFRGDRLFMRAGEVGRWVDMGYRRRRVKIDPDDMGAPKEDYDQISLGSAMGADLAGDYNNARFM